MFTYRSYLPRVISAATATNKTKPIIRGNRLTMVNVVPDKLALVIVSWITGIATPTPTITATNIPMNAASDLSYP